MIVYAAWTAGLLGILVVAAWVAFDETVFGGVALAGAMAWPVQVFLFGMTVGRLRKGNSFLAAWASGSLVRLGLIAIGALIAWRRPEMALPLMLGLAGFLFLMLLLEAPVLVRMDRARLNRGVR